MNETAGDGIRDAISGCNGTGTATANASGRIGYGRNFNGAQSITTSTCTFKVVTGCVSAWIYITTHVVNGAIVKVTTFPKGWMMNINTGTQVEFATYDGSANPKVADPVVQSNSTWVHYVGCYRNNTVTSMRLWRNGNPIVNSTPAIGRMVEAQEGLTFGLNSGFYFKGVIDEVGFWNRFLNDTEIVTMYDNYLNGSTPLNSSSGGGGTTISINAINLTNGSGTYYNTIYEDFQYYIRVNATPTGLNCNFSQQNLTDNFIFPSSNNASLNSTISQINFSYYDLTEGTLQEKVSAQICYTGGVAKDLQYYFNNINVLNISGGIIPPCSNGFYSFNNISGSNFQNTTNIKFSCADCGGVNNLRLVTINGSLINFYRRHGNSTHSLTYNSTTQLYHYDNSTGEHLHSFFIAGNYSTVVNCNGTLSALTTVVAPINPVSKITGVSTDGNFYSLVNGSIIERVVNYSFLGDCAGVSIDSINISLHNITGKLITQNNSVNLLLNISQLSKVALYTLNISCKSTSNQTSKTGIIFLLNDSISPEIVVSEELDSNIEFYVNYSLPIDITFSDKNLFGVNVSCKLDSTPIFDWLKLNLSMQEYHLNYSLNNLSNIGTLSCYIEVCDDHTEELYLLKDGALKTDSLKKEVIINDELLLKDVSIYDVKSLTFTQKIDRVSYCFEYDTYNYKGVKTFKFEIPFGNWVLRNGKIGHFANWNTKQWMDFVPSKDTLFVVKKIYKEENNMILEIDSNLDSLCMESIGGLNCENITLSYSIVDIPIPEVPIGNLSLDCDYDTAPLIRLKVNNKIPWSCDLTKDNSSEVVSCITKLYDAENTSRLIQINPSYDDFKSKSTLIGGGNELDKVNTAFYDDNGVIIVYFDGNIFDNIRNRVPVTGVVECSSNYGKKGTFTANFTPEFADFKTENTFRAAAIMDNASLIIALILGIIFIGIIFVMVAYFYKRR